VGRDDAVVVFGYLHCPNLTPVALRALAWTAAQLSPERRAQLNIMFVTVDPDRDTPRRLQAYLRTLPAEIHGFTGTGAALASMRAGLYVHAYREFDGSFNHGDSVGLVDASGRLRRVYFPSDLTDGTLLRDLPRLIGARSGLHAD